MEGNLNQQARGEYTRAMRQGQREVSARTAKGERGILPALDELTSQTRVVAYMKQPQSEIPLSQVVGTYTAARANSFSYSFLPLHPEGSEFASKWTNLCAIHMSEGLRDAVQVYEYLWQYYVIEGNKRVSILKHFGAPSVRADVTRVVPQLDPHDPDTAVYYAFLKYNKTGLFRNIRLSSQEKYQKLTRLEAELLALIDPKTEINPNAMFLQFEAAFHKVNPPMILGDAFLEYLKVYGLPQNTVLSQVEEQLTALLPQMELAINPPAQPTLVLTPQEKPQAGLITRLFGQRRHANVVFAYPAGRTEDNWIGAHERGRQAMQEKLGEQITSSYIDGLSPINMAAMLTEHAKDADLLIITASELALPSLRFALEHPDCLTLVYSRIREDYRLSTYYGRYYEAMFLCGMAAGMATQNNTVAYITPRFAYKRHTADINAFGLGVRSVRPGCDVYLVTRDVLPYQPLTCAQGLLHAARVGADVAYTPRFLGLPQLSLEPSTFSVLGRIDKEGKLTEYLASPQWDWGRYYTLIADSFLAGSLDILKIIDRGDPSVTGLWWGLGAGVLRFLVAPGMESSGEQMLHFLRSQISMGSFSPFRGPLFDHMGQQHAPPGSDLAPYDILNMEWLCHFIKTLE